MCVCVLCWVIFHALNINRMSTAFRNAFYAQRSPHLTISFFVLNFKVGWHTKDFWFCSLEHRFLTGRHQNFFPNCTKNSRLTGSKRSDGLKPRFFSMTQLLVLFERRRWKTGVWIKLRFTCLVALCAGVPNERCIVNILKKTLSLFSFFLF